MRVTLVIFDTRRRLLKHWRDFYKNKPTDIVSLRGSIPQSIIHQRSKTIFVTQELEKIQGIMPGNVVLVGNDFDDDILLEAQMMVDVKNVKHIRIKDKKCT